MSYECHAVHSLFYITLPPLFPPPGPLTPSNPLQLTSGAPPQLSRVLKIQHDKPVVSCIAAHENLNYLAIGLADGTVLLYKGDITRERGANKHPKLLFKAKEPVSGIAFRPVGRSVILYVATFKEVYACTLEPRENIELLAGSTGGAVDCCAVSDTDGDFWIADNDVSGNGDLS